MSTLDIDRYNKILSKHKTQRKRVVINASSSDRYSMQKGTPRDNIVNKLGIPSRQQDNSWLVPRGLNLRGLPRKARVINKYGGSNNVDTIKRPFKIYPKDHQCKPVFFQQIDDCVIEFVLNNKKLQEISKRYLVVFVYSGGKHRDKIIDLYDKVVILDSLTNWHVDKFKIFRSWALQRNDFDVIIRTCPDAVIMDVDWLLDIADNEVLGKNLILGNIGERPGMTWVSGGCNIYSKSILNQLKYSNYDYVISKAGGQGFDIWFHKCIKISNINQKQYKLFNSEYIYLNKYPAWHPPKELSKNDKIELHKYYANIRKIALLVPSRERIDKIKKLINSITHTVYDISNITLYLGIDEDDPTRSELIELTKNFNFIKIVNIPPTNFIYNLGVLWNKCAKESIENIISMIGDDMEFETPNWDIQIIKEFDVCDNNGFKLVYCHDGHSGKKAVNLFINRSYIDVTGYFMREEFPVDGVDVWLQDVYTNINRIIKRSDIIIKHNHWSFTGDKDKTFKRMNYETKSIKTKKLFKKLETERKNETQLISNYLNNQSIIKLNTSNMKILSFYTPSHKILFDNYFYPSYKQYLSKDFELLYKTSDQLCESANYRTKGWAETVIQKLEFILDYLTTLDNKIFIFSDCDVQFLNYCTHDILYELSDYDIKFQNDLKGSKCSGFFIAKNNINVKNLIYKSYELFKKNIRPGYGDQKAINDIIKKYPNIAKIGLLNSDKYFTVGNINGKQWNGEEFYPPINIMVHHANWTVGIDNKIKLLEYVKRIN